MNKKTVIQMHWIDLGFEPSQPDENGWIDFDFLPDGFYIGNLDAETRKNPITKRTCTFVRPKSLKGLEDNNGWKKIEWSDDLPPTIAEYHVVFDFGTLSERIGKAWYHGSNKWNTERVFILKTTKEMNISHYRKIITPDKLPLYFV